MIRLGGQFLRLPPIVIMCFYVCFSNNIRVLLVMHKLHNANYSNYIATLYTTCLRCVVHITINKYILFLIIAYECFINY